mmetsp:Transcript_41112/g.96472  ORF Transcript_41112/g.96472 Transcript_41112/m.96472 type:complete len:307 (+) Transcript_41112:521-1441(+)
MPNLVAPLRRSSRTWREVSKEPKYSLHETLIVRIRGGTATSPIHGRERVRAWFKIRDDSRQHISSLLFFGSENGAARFRKPGLEPRAERRLLFGDYRMPHPFRRPALDSGAAEVKQRRNSGPMQFNRNSRIASTVPPQDRRGRLPHVPTTNPRQHLLEIPSVVTDQPAAEGNGPREPAAGISERGKHSQRASLTEPADRQSRRLPAAVDERVQSGVRRRDADFEPRVAGHMRERGAGQREAGHVHPVRRRLVEGRHVGGRRLGAEDVDRLHPRPLGKIFPLGRSLTQSVDPDDNALHIGLNHGSEI